VQLFIHIYQLELIPPTGCGNASVQPFALAFIAYPFLCWVPPCYHLSESTGRIGCLFMGINEPSKLQTCATKFIDNFALLGLHKN
jgi:hypothetical protein